MHPASRRQIVQMLETFSLAPEVSAFDLGCLNHATGRMSFRKTWTAPEVRRALGWLAARNATGSSCYIRPAAALGRTSWVLAGPLTAEAWLRLAVPADLDTRTAVARFFTRKAGGDPGAVRGAQLGQLPGTTNRAPASAGDGPASFVVLRWRSPSAVREQTAPEFRWMWSSERAYKDEHADAYAQVAGSLAPRWHRRRGQYIRELDQAGWLTWPATADPAAEPACRPPWRAQRAKEDARTDGAASAAPPGGQRTRTPPRVRSSDGTSHYRDQ